MFELLPDVMDNSLNLPDTNAECAIALLTSKVSNRCAHLHESDRTLRDGSFGLALSQPLRARLRSHRPSGTFYSPLYGPLRLSPIANPQLVSFWNRDRTRPSPRLFRPIACTQSELPTSIPAPTNRIDNENDDQSDNDFGQNQSLLAERGGVT